MDYLVCYGISNDKEDHLMTDLECMLIRDRKDKFLKDPKANPFIFLEDSTIDLSIM